MQEGDYEPAETQAVAPLGGGGSGGDLGVLYPPSTTLHTTHIHTHTPGQVDTKILQTHYTHLYTHCKTGRYYIHTHTSHIHTHTAGQVDTTVHTHINKHPYTPHTHPYTHYITGQVDTGTTYKQYTHPYAHYRTGRDYIHSLQDRLILSTLTT